MYYYGETEFHQKKYCECISPTISNDGRMCVNCACPIRPASMNNESKCCERCGGHAIGPTAQIIPICQNSLCPCHTPAPEDWEGKYKRDKKFFSELEEVLDEYFPKVEEEGEAKRLMKRAEALMLFSAANMIHSRLLASEKAAARREGAERAVEFIRKTSASIPHPEVKDALLTTEHALNAARSEGVNG